MTRSLRIAVAEDEKIMQKYLGETLTLLGYEVLCLVDSGRELVEKCQELHPDLVITDINLPDQDGLEAAAAIYATEPVPIIVVSAFHDPELIARAEKSHILAYLVKPIKQQDLEPAIAIAMTRFGEFRAMRQEADHLRQALEDRKLIERAKGLLMKRAGLDEPEAFRRLQNLARNKNKKLVEIAQIVITVEEAYQSGKELVEKK
jgi:response regulator NasT